jgi:hypothetical protein
MIADLQHLATQAHQSMMVEPVTNYEQVVTSHFALLPPHRLLVEIVRTLQMIDQAAEVPVEVWECVNGAVCDRTQDGEF